MTVCCSLSNQTEEQATLFQQFWATPPGAVVLGLVIAELYKSILSLFKSNRFWQHTALVQF